jgi:hypothetical protein
MDPIIFYRDCLRREHKLIDSMVDALTVKLKLRRELGDLILNGYLFYDPGHFSVFVNEVISNQSFAKVIDTKFCDQIYIAGLYLKNVENYKSLNTNIESAVSWMKINNDNQYQFRMITRRVAKSAHEDIQEIRATNGTAMEKRRDFERITFDQLLQCARAARVARKILTGAGSTTGFQSLRKMFEHYLEHQKPDAWLRLFKGAETVAYFIKYIDRENLDKAFEYIRKRNSTNQPFLNIVDRVRSLLPVPIVDSQVVVEMMKAPDSDDPDKDQIGQFISNLKTQAFQTSNLSLKILKEMTAAWMKNRREVVGIPMAPRNIQMITLLCCAHWASNLFQGGNSEGTTLLAQVGTGEGKSLIIAMMGVYLNIVCNKRVHVLENNLGLLEKDTSQFRKLLFDEFKINVISASEAGEGFGEDARTITYCLRRPIESFYRKSVMERREPFSNTVLIVDEVDNLIVDGDPNQSYVQVDSDSQLFQKCFDRLMNGQTNDGTIPTFVWKSAQEAYQSAKSWVKGRDYRELGDKYYKLDNKGRPEKNSYYSEIEFLAYRDKHISPSFMTRFYLQSLPHMFSQYEAIFGFSGSLGSPSERLFLNKHYRAFNFEVPPFLDTCTNVNKHPPDLKKVEVFENEHDQETRIASLAVEQFQLVPVLIICGTTTQARRIFEKVTNQIGKSKIEFPINKSSNDYVQLFLEVDPITGENMNWGDKVEKATHIDNGWTCITITDPFGGRGHDFRVTEDEIDAKGGLLVIMSSIPESEREWIQWKGRTARDDCKGQYMVILNKEDEPCKNFTEYSKHQNIEDSGSAVYQESLIAELLVKADEKKLEQLNKYDTSINRGKMLNELCDKFYLKYGKTETWPDTQNHRYLRDFLNEHSWDATLGSIRDLAQLVGIVSSKDSYVSKYV